MTDTKLSDKIRKLANAKLIISKSMTSRITKKGTGSIRHFQLLKFIPFYLKPV